MQNPSWKQFHHACGKIAVYFDNYVQHRHSWSVRVFTSRPNQYRREVNDLIYLCRGEGHDVISASIDGLRKSGGSSLEAWIAALQLQLDQLNGAIEFREIYE